MAVKRITLLLIFFLKLSYAFAQDDKVIIIPTEDQQEFCLASGQVSAEIEMEVRIPPNFCEIKSYKIDWNDRNKEDFAVEIKTSNAVQVFRHKHTYTSSLETFVNSCDESKTYSVIVEVNVEGCARPTRDSYPITFVNSPVASFKADSSCVNQNIELKDLKCSNIDDPLYSWDFGDGTTSTFLLPSKKYTVAGTYEIGLSISNKNQTNCGVSASQKQNIVITDIPKAVLADSGSIEISADTLLICYSKDKAIIRLDGSKSENATEYNWSFTNNGIKLLDSTTTKQVRPKISFEKTGIYSVTLEVDNVCKKKSTKRVFYKVIEAPVPQAVSPPQSCTAIDFEVPDRNDGAKYYLNDNIVESGKIIRIDTSSTPYTLVTELSTQCGTASKAVSFNISPPRPVNITSK
jgi:PKD repeat protein